MSPASDRPFDLRAPFDGDIGQLTITSDIGATAPLEVVAARLDDLTVLVGLGERWGFELARAAAEWDLRNSSLHPGDDISVLEEAARFGFTRRDLRGGPYWGPDGVLENARSDVFRTMADVRAAGLVGTPIRVVRIEYVNPLALFLMSSGMILTGVILAARFLRDWSNKRAADAAVVREAHAEASITESRADLYRWLVDEAKAGRAPMPVGQLVSIVTPAEIKALDRLADSPLTIVAPNGSDPTPPAN